MKITNFDTDLILALLELKGASTTKLAKMLFSPEGDYELRKADNKIRYRLERMRRKELLRKNGVKYTVNEGRVFLTSAEMQFEIGIVLPMGTVLAVFPKDEKIMFRKINVEANQKTAC